MTAPSIALMTEIAHIGTAELNGGGKVSTIVVASSSSSIGVIVIDST